VKLAGPTVEKKKKRKKGIKGNSFHHAEQIAKAKAIRT
jgi:hypothetical protein